jgi:hypothetical protein
MTVQQVSHLFFQLCAFSTVVCDSGVTERSWCWPTSGGELSDLGVGENTREFCVWAEGVRHPGRVSDTLGGCPTPGCRTPSVSGPRSRLLEGGGVWDDFGIRIECESVYFLHSHAPRAVWRGWRKEPLPGVPCEGGGRLGRRSRGLAGAVPRGRATGASPCLLSAAARAVRVTSTGRTMRGCPTCCNCGAAPGAVGGLCEASRTVGAPSRRVAAATVAVATADRCPCVQTCRRARSVRRRRAAAAV